MFRDLKHSPINFAADISIVEPKYKRVCATEP